MISTEFLRKLGTEYKLSKAELEVFCELSNLISRKIDTLEMLAKKLEIKLPTVQKRLSKIYKAFDIEETGPTKLRSLLSIITSKHEEKEGKKKIYIIWSGASSKTLADGLRDNIFNNPRLEVWIADSDFVEMETLKPDLVSSLEDFDFVIACITHISDEENTGNIFRKTSNYICFIFGQVRNLKLITFSDSIDFWGIPTAFGNSKEQLTRLLAEILSDQEEAQAWIDKNFPVWQNILEREQKDIKDFTKTCFGDNLNKITEKIAKINNRKEIKDNPCLMSIINQSFEDIATSLSKIEHNHELGYPVPSILYNMYLYSLQIKAQKNREEFLIKATSFLGESKIWASDAGEKIRITTNPKSTRIFIFSNKFELEENEKIIIKHAQSKPNYKVFILSYCDLAIAYQGLLQQFQKIVRLPDESFAIFQHQDSKIVVDSGKKIGDNPFSFTHFDGDPKRLDAFEQWMDIILRHATPIPESNKNDAQQIISKAKQLAPTRDSDN